MPTPPLKRVLLMNAAYTAVCGVIAFAFAGPLTSSFGLGDSDPVQAVGVFLLVVAIAMAASAQVVARTKVPAMLLTVGDVGYVLASLAVALMPGLLSATGKAVVLGVAALVAVFVVAQARALK